MEGDWPYVWLDATYVKVRQGGRIVSVAVTIAIGVNADGRREVLGIAIGCSDAHEGLKAAISRVLNATWQRCRVHFMRNLLAHAGRNGRKLAAAFVGTVFAQQTKLDADL